MGGLIRSLDSTYSSLTDEPICVPASHASDEVRSILHHRLSNGRQPVSYIEYEAASVTRPWSGSRVSQRSSGAKHPPGTGERSDGRADNLGDGSRGLYNEQAPKPG